MKKLFSETEFDNAKSRDKLPLECLNCHSTFLKQKSIIQNIENGQTPMMWKKGNFCSIKCCRYFQEPPIIVRCFQCYKEFKKLNSQIKKSKRNFCCQSCAAKYNNTHKTKGTRISKIEKWIQEQLQLLYPTNDYFHFNRKDAINSELDIYIPSLKLAFELNGIFHYEPIYGPDKLSSIQNNDNRKLQACIEKGIEFCIIDISSIRHFKILKAQKFLDIIVNVINLKIQSGSPIGI